jgi:hypothetical protein
MYWNDWYRARFRATSEAPFVLATEEMADTDPLASLTASAVFADSPWGLPERVWGNLSDEVVLRKS